MYIHTHIKKVIRLLSSIKKILLNRTNHENNQILPNEQFGFRHLHTQHHTNYLD